MLYLRIDDTHLSLLAYERSATIVSEASTSVLGEEFPFLHRPLHPSLPFARQLAQLRAAHPAFVREQAVRVVVSGTVTPVPIADFEEEMCSRYYDFCVGGDEGGSALRRVFYDSLPGFGAVLLFALPESMCQSIEHEFSEVHYVSASTALLRRIAHRHNPRHHHRIYVYLRGRKMEVAVFEEQNLLVLNAYDVQAATDVAYYCFGLSRGLGLDVQHTSFTLFGDEPLRSESAEQLRAYAPMVAARSLSTELNRHPLADVPDIPFDLPFQILTL